MADFKLSAEIEMQAAQALREIDKVKKATKSTEREFNLLGRSITLDTKRIGAGLKKITGIAGVMFSAIALASPSMRAAFKQMEIAAYVLSIELGESLAPVIEDTLVPAVQLLTDTVIDLDPEMQQWISLTVSLTLLLGILTIAIAALTIEVLLLAGAVGLVAGAFALAIIFFRKGDDEVGFLGLTFKDLGNMILGVIMIIGIIALVLSGPLVLAIAGVIALIALLILNWDDITDSIVKFGDMLVWLGTVPVKLLETSVDGFADHVSEKFGSVAGFIVAFFGGIAVTITDIFGTIITIIGDFIIAIGKLLKGDWGGFVDAMVNILFDAINFFIRAINNLFIKPINILLDGINAVAGLLGFTKITKMGLLDEIPRKQEGGTIERTGLIFAHRGEEVLRPVEARQFRQRTSSTSGGNTFIFNNTYKIGSINSRSQMLAYARENAANEKREMNRRFHA